MKLSSSDTVRTKLESTGLEVHFVYVTQDRQVMVCRTSHKAFSDALLPLPALFVHLCISGGGPVYHDTNLQKFDVEISPGAIGIVPPGSKGSGHWPEMTAISIAISANAVKESFGDTWHTRLKSNVMSQIFRDPLVEAVMMDIGFTRTGSISDAGLVHAAHMITHQLLDKKQDQPCEQRDVIPLSNTSIDRIVALLDENLDRQVSVPEMAGLLGLSKHHFSRRFKAATGQSPIQFSIRRRLDHAASLLENEQCANILKISQCVGFNNPSHFSRAFRQHFGLSPRHWRSENMRPKGE